jgi:hypothetical protein
LGARREASAVAVLSKMLAGDNRAVAEAAAMALGNIASSEAAKGLAETRAENPDRPPAFVTRASLLCAERMASRGEKAAANGIYQELYNSTKEPLFRTAAKRGLAMTKPAANTDDPR